MCLDALLEKVCLADFVISGSLKIGSQYVLAIELGLILCVLCSEGHSLIFSN
jgi:hypothetical protein